MNLETFHKSQELYTDLISINAEITTIEKTAKAIAENGKAVTIIVQEEKENEAAVLDGEGNLINPQQEQNRLYAFYMPLSLLHTPQPQPEKVSTPFGLDDVEALTVLGALLAVKKEKRKRIVDQFRELGFTL